MFGRLFLFLGLGLSLLSCSKASLQQPVTPKLSYEWQRGDDLEVVANRYNTSKENLLKINHLPPHKTIPPGFVLLIPPPTNPETHADLANARYLHSFIWPVQGPMSSGFGQRGKQFHYGVDIRAPLGYKIKSVLNGLVIASAFEHGYGNVVVIQHSPSLVTMYAHNQKNLVKQGTRVVQGQTIATVGNSGNAQGYHLHFEIHDSGRPVNPLLFLSEKNYDYATVTTKSKNLSAKE